MLKEVFEINEQGFIIEKYVGEFKEGNLITDFGGKSMVLTDLPQPSHYIKPRWNGSDWVEGELETERKEREEKESQQPPSPPTQEERIKMLEDTINFLLEL